MENPFANKPLSVHPAMLGTMIDEEDKNDVRMDNDDFEFTKDFSGLIDN